MNLTQRRKGAKGKKQILCIFAPSRKVLFVCLIVLLLPAIVNAQDSAVPVDGAPFRAKLVAADANWRLTFADGDVQKTMLAADLVRWGNCAEQGRGGFAVFTDGSLLATEVVSADKDRITLDGDSFGTEKLPLESLAGVVFHSPSDHQRRDALQDRLLRDSGDADRAILDNGDEITGLVEGISADAVTIKTAARRTAIQLDRVAAILFNPSLRQKPAAKKNAMHAWVGLADGSRLLASQLIFSGNSLEVTVAGQTLKMSPKQLVFLQPLGGRSIYLSDQKPAAYRQTPYLNLAWPYGSDCSVTGGMLRVGDQLFIKGIGVHSAARLGYDLSPLPLGEGQGVRAAIRFDALACIDDSAAGQGSVVFRVLVDGHERFASKTIRGGDRPVPISVDLRGAKRLELVVDWADRADVLDHADWLDARVTLTPSP